MQSLKTGLDHQIAHFGEESAKAFKVARNNAAFERAVQQTWSENPDAADYVLAHVNSLYFAKDDALRKGEAKAHERYVLGVYLDDPMARSELNARREVLMLHLMRQGLRFDELRIIPSTMGMRERCLYPDARGRVRRLFGAEAAADEAVAWPPHDVTPSDIAEISARVEDVRLAAALEGAMRAYAEPHAGSGAPVSTGASGGGAIEDAELVAIVRRAICLGMGGLDEADALLSGVTRVTLKLCPSRGSVTPPRYRRYWCTLCGPNPPLLERLLAPHEDAVIAGARELGLSIQSISYRCE